MRGLSVDGKKCAVLMGPFVGELYWEGARFAPMLPHMMQTEYKNRKDITYIILTRKERFDLYGRFADILVPLRIPGDYSRLNPNCFRLNGLKPPQYQEIVDKFKRKYSQRYKILKHIYPDVSKGQYVNKNQYRVNKMRHVYSPRKENYKLVNEYIPNGKPIVVLGSRFRKGFKRNWKYWQKFYDLLWKRKDLLKDFTFVICGKDGEYKGDSFERFYDMNKIKVGEESSLVGILLVILERAFFTFGSQSAIPNFSLLHGVDVLEFGCQKTLHTRTYNIKKTPITFIDDRKYNSDPNVMLNKLEKLIRRKQRNERKTEQSMASAKQSPVSTVKKRDDRIQLQGS
jgi:hypothetical protein